MIYQELEQGNHEWEKQNLMTISSKKGSYDILHCKCGLKGKSRRLGFIELDGRKKSKAKKCTFYKLKEKTGKKIKITHCTASGKLFANAIDNSEHILITPPKDRDKTEFWINGVGEPIRLMKNEFVFID